MAIYNVPDSAGDKKSNRFQFRIKGEVYSVPFLQYLSGDTAEFIESIVGKPYSEASVTRKMLSLETPECAEAVRKLRNDQVDALSTQWAEASTATVGESLASES